MRFNSNRNSNRPADPNAYWRRRFFILGGGLTVLALLAWLFTSNGPVPASRTSAVARSATAALRAGASLPSAAYGSPAAGPTLTTPVMSPPATTAPAAPAQASGTATATGAQASPAASASVGAAAQRCAPGNIVLSLFTSQPSYGQTARPRFEVYAVSTASSPCRLPYGTGSVRVVVTRHGQVVWDSVACGSPAAKTVPFQLGVPQLLTVSWNRQAASPAGCAGTLQPGASGTFDAVAMTAGQSSQVRTFRLRG